MPITKEYQEFCKKCNNEVKLCQTCYFFLPVVFDYEEEYYEDDDLGIFTLWVWSGYCVNESMPNIFPALHHNTKSNRKCKWYITEKEYDILIQDYKDKELTSKEYNQILSKIREGLRKE